VEKEKIVPVVDSVVPFEDFETAFRLLSDSSQFGKVVIEVTGPAANL
jgi:hypothetical protein